jgi:hypothetical protein
MNKFTIFTIILAVSVITVMADLVIRDYFGASTEFGESEASVIREPEPNYAVIPDIAPEPAAPEPATPEPVATEPVAIPPSATVTLAKIREAGFTGNFMEKHFEGKLFQLLDITKNPVDAIGFYEISQDVGPIASVTEIALRDEIRALQLYSLLQNKTKPYIDLTLNETNAYGDRSFYINHAKKQGEAFLTVKIGRMIYGFAYVKFYHPEVKKLIQLLIP